ncbi:MAG: hypothetical protein EOO63_04785 [Hymenobacter sp.]|nr:MAG: hypothetical protein EOO63_04785 [Hymenobacter sp.]
MTPLRQTNSHLSSNIDPLSSPLLIDKAIQTSANSTLLSMQASLGLVMQGGMVSVTTYPANAPGGPQEHEQVLSYI